MPLLPQLATAAMVLPPHTAIALLPICHCRAVPHHRTQEIPVTARHAVRSLVLLLPGVTGLFHSDRAALNRDRRTPVVGQGGLCACGMRHVLTLCVQLPRQGPPASRIAAFQIASGVAPNPRSHQHLACMRCCGSWKCSFPQQRHGACLRCLMFLLLFLLPEAPGVLAAAAAVERTC
jgi:hypothetical protein